MFLCHALWWSSHGAIQEDEINVLAPICLVRISLAPSCSSSWPFILSLRVLSSGGDKEHASSNPLLAVGWLRSERCPLFTINFLWKTGSRNYFFRHFTTVAASCSLMGKTSTHFENTSTITKCSYWHICNSKHVYPWVGGICTKSICI